MPEQVRTKLSNGHSMRNDLNNFRRLFHSIFEATFEERDISRTSDALPQLSVKDLRTLTIVLLSSLPETTSGTVQADLRRLITEITSEDFSRDRVQPLIAAALADEPDETLIWNLVSAAAAAAESTPPPQSVANTDTPWRHSTGSIVNSSEYRQDIDPVLKRELGDIHINVPGFHKRYFGGVPNLEAISEAVFQMCTSSDDPLFERGWIKWPNDAKQDDVLDWFLDIAAKFEEFAKEHSSLETHRRLLALPNSPIRGSTGKRKLDICFVIESDANKVCDWSQVLIPGELKSNPLGDTVAKAGLDLGRYAREVLAAQDTRRYVLGFTICGPWMRIWEFDRSGGLASDQFNINDDGQQFVKTVLGFLWMGETDLGFDPTIITSGNERYIKIQDKGDMKHIKLEELMTRTRCVAGRATTCWKAHDEENPGIPLVIKDSWQDIGRVEEGKLLQKATAEGVTNVARYYYHGTVVIDEVDDDIFNNVRKGLQIPKATTQRTGRRKPLLPLQTSTSASCQSRSSSAGVKRPSSEMHGILPPSKRSCPGSLMETNTLPNRVHRRIIVRDYGKPIFKASSPAALLSALDGCIQGHQSLYSAGFLHRDISINNLMINEDPKNPSWKSFIIDLDLAIELTQERYSSASGKTGTRAFMAIGALLGEHHTFMHDLESFFWVFFWICIHYNGPNEMTHRPVFDSWNYESDDRLVQLKSGTVGDEGIFLKIAEENFTPFYRPLIQIALQLRKQVFPKGERWKTRDLNLYSLMTQVFVNFNQLE
ncbi:serine/threonine-protein kinase Sgk2 [Trichoderma ceciliae]